MIIYDTALSEQLRDPTYLPSHADFTRVFGDDPHDMEASERWSRYARHSDPEHYEILNTEFIASLGSYITQRAAALEIVPVVLEVAAGSGRLAHFLNQYFAASSDIQVIATDSGDWNETVIFPVEKLNCDEAVNKYKPHIVICSWMPPGVDFSSSFRSCPNVKEYLVVGEYEGGCCGNDELWGYTWVDDYFVKSELPAYKADGFTLEFLYDISSNQICRTDDINRYIHSKTASFKRA